MARLPNETLKAIFNIQQQLLELIHNVTATELALFERHGEIPAIQDELEQLQNASQRLRDRYSGLYVLMLRVAEAQPVAPSAIVEMLEQNIERSQSVLEAVAATLQDTKRNWNVL